MHTINDTSQTISYGYTHEDDGKIDTIASSADEGTYDYDYDAQDQLTAVDYTGTGDGVDESYQYDANGNRESSTIDGLTAIYTTGPYNRTEIVDDGTDVWVYSYDSEGNTTGKAIWRDAVIDGGDGDGQIEIAEMVDTVFYTWDHRNRLVSARNYDNFAAAMAETLGQTAMIASDLVRFLPEAMRRSEPPPARAPQPGE